MFSEVEPSQNSCGLHLELLWYFHMNRQAEWYLVCILLKNILETWESLIFLVNLNSGITNFIVSNIKTHFLKIKCIRLSFSECKRIEFHFRATLRSESNFFKIDILKV